MGKLQKNFRLDEKTADLLRRMSDFYGTTETAMVELAVTEYAIAKGFIEGPKPETAQ